MPTANENINSSTSSQGAGAVLWEESFNKYREERTKLEKQILDFQLHGVEREMALREKI